MCVCVCVCVCVCMHFVPSETALVNDLNEVDEGKAHKNTYTHTEHVPEFRTCVHVYARCCVCVSVCAPRALQGTNR